MALSGAAFVRADHCRPVRIPATGTLHGIAVRTAVDSEAARYLLEEYFAGHRSRPKIDRAADHFESTSRAEVSAAAQVSTDFVALLLASRLIQENAAVQDSFLRHLASNHVDIQADDVSALLIPGWLYRRHPETGANLERELRVLRHAGIDARRIEVDENGSIETNAATIAEQIRRRRERRIILISASKGGPETALALRMLPPTERQHVVAWVNVGGILRGTALADDALVAPKRWLTGIVLRRRCQSVVSMTRGAIMARAHRIPQPPLIVNYVGIPLSGDVSPRAREGYCALRRDGPNDGLTLITDAIAPDSVTITTIGADHYFQLPDADRRTVALLATVLDLLDRQIVR